MIPLLLAASALASPTFPPTIQAETGSECLPPCTVCHADLVGGAGTVVQPFGEMLVGRGLVGADTDLLVQLLGDVGADGVDTDGDGTPDLDELAADTDPNPDGAAFCTSVPPPVYGCLSHTSAAPAAVLVLLAALGARRARR